MYPNAAGHKYFIFDLFQIRLEGLFVYLKEKAAFVTLLLVLSSSTRKIVSYSIPHRPLSYPSRNREPINFRPLCANGIFPRVFFMTRINIKFKTVLMNSNEMQANFHNIFLSSQVRKFNFVSIQVI